MPHRLQKSNAVDSENHTKCKNKVNQLNDELTVETFGIVNLLEPEFYI